MLVYRGSKHGRPKMAGLVAGKVVLITGAARGIGEATARLFAAEGARVLLTDIDARGQDVAATIPGAGFMRVDVTRESEVTGAVDHAVEVFGGLDVMINNVGLVGVTGSISDLDADGWRQTMNIVLDGAFHGVKHAARAMKARRSGRILTTASTAGLEGGIGAHGYTAAKHGIIGLVRSAAAELARYGICVNAVAPGVTVTPMAVEGLGGFEAACAYSAELSPLGRPIMPEDIAGAFLYLASDLARNVTGQTLVVDGGYTGVRSTMAEYTYQ
jgi:NAD(P)-dependent dehydrogenase (short-subunit alcohol dehydrogenase family)